MNEQILLEPFIVSYNEQVFEARLHPDKCTKKWQQHLFLGILGVMFLFIAVMGILEKAYFFILLGGIFFLLLFVAWIYLPKEDEEFINQFCFLFNSDGITYRDHKNIIFMAWDEVEIFGIANSNQFYYGGITSGSIGRIILYFAKSKYNKNELGKKLSIGRSVPYVIADHHILAMAFREPNEQFLCEKLLRYVYAHCEKEKQKDYTDGMYLSIEPICCDARSFELQVMGDIKHSFSSRLRLLAENGCVGAAGKCKICGKRKVFFERTNEDFPMRKTVSCPKCGANDFSVRITKKYIDTDETINLPLAEKFSYEGKGNVSRMKISLSCNECKKTYENFFDLGEL